MKHAFHKAMSLLAKLWRTCICTLVSKWISSGRVLVYYAEPATIVNMVLLDANKVILDVDPGKFKTTSKEVDV